MKTSQKPTEEVTKEGVRYKHPAFGKIQVTRSTGGNLQLFGSELRHNNQVRLCISTAMLDRHYNTDWIHDDVIKIEVALSEAQWARMVSSIGMGSGTPCTLMYAAPEGTPLENIPDIDMISLREKFQSDIKKQVKAMQEGATAVLARMATFKDKPPTKKEFAELQSQLGQALRNNASNTAFVHECMVESMEEVIEHGKTEVEAFVMATAQKLGIAAFENNQAFLSLPDKDKE